MIYATVTQLITSLQHILNCYGDNDKNIIMSSFTKFLCVLMLILLNLVTYFLAYKQNNELNISLPGILLYILISCVLLLQFFYSKKGLNTKISVYFSLIITLITSLMSASLAFNIITTETYIKSECYGRHGCWLRLHVNWAYDVL